MPDFSPTEYAVPGFVALVLIEMLWARRARRDAGSDAEAGGAL